MNTFRHLSVLVSLIALTVACNDDNGSTTPDDAGIDDIGHDDANIIDAAPDANSNAATDAKSTDVEPDEDPLDAWPGQEIDAEPFDVDWDMPESDDGLRFLVANVGNVDIMRCGNVAFNMCWTEQEKIVAEEIAARDADVILLQEVLTTEQCDALDDDDVDDDHVCHSSYAPDEPEQARRLVGDDYTIACDAQQGWECVATRVGAVSIVGCQDGQFCRDFARTNAPIDGCDPGFTVSAVTIEFDDRLLDVVNVHPPSDAPGTEDPQQCRHDYFQTFFDDDAPLIEEDKVLVAGDFNFDPYRQSEDNPDVAIWHEFVSTSFEQTRDDRLTFAYHSGLPEHNPPYFTTPILDRTLDHAISNGLYGRCITLGAQPGEAPLDRAKGHPIEQLDHFALECVLN